MNGRYLIIVDVDMSMHVYYTDKPVLVKMG